MWKFLKKRFWRFLKLISKMAKGLKLPFILISIALIIRFALMALFPVIGDEAYYVYWGLHPDGGYYDLSPMVAWWLAPIVQLWKSGQGWVLEPFVNRIPNFLVMIFVSLGIYFWTRQIDRKRALWMALIFFFLPVPYLLVFIAPDVPLILLSFLSVASFFWADQTFQKQNRISLSAVAQLFLAGLFWGGAFLSKYFAAALVPGVLVYIFVTRPNFLARIKAFWMVIPIVLGALPALMQHWYWNSEHCWANFVFNLVVRQAASDGTYFEVVGFFVLYLAILAYPFGKKIFSKPFAVTDSSLVRLRKFFLLMWLVPMILFSYTVFVKGKGQGLHWYISYLPFFVMWVGLKLNELQLRRMFYFAVSASIVLASFVGLGITVGSPVLESKLNSRHKLDFAMSTQPKMWVEKIFEFEKRALPASNYSKRIWVIDSYTLASQLEIALKRFFPIEAQNIEIGVWDQGVRFGRVFDWSVNWKDHEGKSVLVFSRGEIPAWNWNEFFGSVQSQTVPFGKSMFWISAGQGFKSSLYVERMVRPALERFYPAWIFPAKCEFPTLGGSLR